MAENEEDFQLKIESTQKNSQEDMDSAGGAFEKGGEVDDAQEENSDDENFPYSQKRLNLMDPMIRKDLGLSSKGDDDEESGDSDDDSGKDEIDTKNSSKDSADVKAKVCNTKENSKIIGTSEEKINQNRDKKDAKEIAAKEGGKAAEESPKMIKEIEERKTKKRKLKLEIQDLNVQLGDAEENRTAKRIRVAVLEEMIKEQTKELNRQKEEDGEEEKKEKSIWKELMKGIDTKTEDVSTMMENLKGNVGRITHGKQQNCPEKNKVILINTFEEIKISGKFVVVFGPEAAAVKNENIKKEMEKIENFTFAAYKDYGLTDLVNKIRNYTPEIVKENNVGVLMISWMEGAGLGEDEDEEVREKLLNNWTEMLQLAIQRAEDKFGDIIIVLPPASEKSLKAMELLYEKVLPLMKEHQAVINLLEIQKEVGKKLRKAKEKVWKRGKECALAKKFCHPDEENGEMGEYAMGRTFSELAKKLGGTTEDKNLCELCGLNHVEGFCSKTEVVVKTEKKNDK